jgi:hypothetical protein
LMPLRIASRAFTPYLRSFPAIIIYLLLANFIDW